MASIDQVTGTSQIDLIKAASNPSQSETDKVSLADSFDQFLLLLTTQLENQDPTDPLDTNEFTNQLVAFTGVEQQIKGNEHLENLVALNQDAKIDGAVGFIGTTVDAQGDAGILQDGYASFAYDLDVPATSVTVLITDSKGRAVYSGPGPTDAGKNYVVWDGINSFNSSEESDGTYHIGVTAKSASGDTIESKTYTTGVVSGAELVDGSVYLEVADTYVSIDDVQSVRQPQFISLSQNDGNG